MMNPDRVIKCTIEMELIEGEHFNPDGMEQLTDEEAKEAAISSFRDILMNDDISGYIQTRIVE